MGNMIPLNCDLDQILASQIDGNYTYLAYASDNSGTDYSTTYVSGTHFYQAIKTSETEIESPNYSTFTGLWVPIQIGYTYVGYASDSSGSDFNTTYNSSLHSWMAILLTTTYQTSVEVGDFTGLWIPMQKDYTYVGYAEDSSGTGFQTTYNGTTHSWTATLVTNTYKSSPAVGDFTGLWTPMQKTYTYVAYADRLDGTGYTETFDSQKEYVAVKISSTEIVTRTVSTYTGLWRKITPQFKTFNEYVPSFFDTDKKGYHTSSVMANRTFNPLCYYHEGTYKRFYFVFFEGVQNASGTQRTVAGGFGAEYYNRTWLSYYDVETGEFGDPVVFAETYSRPGGAEESAPHNLPSVIVANDGSILVFKEDLSFTGAPGLHNSHIEVWKSDSVEDITSFTKVTELGDWTPEKAFAYPNVTKLSNGNIVVTFRNKVSGNENHQGLMISTDNGANWVNAIGGSTSETNFAQMDNTYGGSFSWFLYAMHASEKDGINLVLNAQDANNDNAGKYIYFLHSDDGITWKNARQFIEGSGGYSRNIVTEGIITNALLNTNFIVDSETGGASLSKMVLDANIDRNGIPYIIANKCDRDGDPSYNNSTNVYLYYYDVSTHAWITVDILPNMIISGNPDMDVVPRFRTSIIPYENGIFDIYTGVTDKDNSELESDTIINSGTLTAGLIYQAVTVSTPGTFGTGIGAGDTFRSNGTETPNGSNTVILVPARLYRFRSSDYGASFQPYKLPDIEYKQGGIGSHGYNKNTILDEKLLSFYPVFESQLGTSVDYQNFLIHYSDLNR